jgi:hypothetical protein
MSGHLFAGCCAFAFGTLREVIVTLRDPAKTAAAMQQKNDLKSRAGIHKNIAELSHSRS